MGEGHYGSLFLCDTRNEQKEDAGSNVQNSRWHVYRCLCVCLISKCLMEALSHCQDRRPLLTHIQVSSQQISILIKNTFIKMNTISNKMTNIDLIRPTTYPLSFAYILNISLFLCLYIIVSFSSIWIALFASHTTSDMLMIILDWTSCCKLDLGINIMFWLLILSFYRLRKYVEQSPIKSKHETMMRT